MAHSLAPAPFLRDYQAETLLALLDRIDRFRGETLTVLFPRQAGKNEVSAALVSALLLANAQSGGSVIVCAPTFLPQARISLERTWLALGRVAPLAGVVPARQDQSLSVGRATATFLSASPEAHAAGHTASIALIADEAQEIDEDWFDRQFRPMAASTAAPTILFGTPWNGETLLDRAVERNRLCEAEAGTQLHFEVSWPRVAAANPPYGAYVAAERERLGAGHPHFVTQYGLQVARSAGRLLTGAQVTAITGRHARRFSPSPGERYVAGLDIGGEGAGSDRTVLTIGRVDAEGQLAIVALFAWDAHRFASLEAELLAIARDWRFERLTVDATGIGATLASRLAERLGASVERFVFTAATKSALGFGLIAAAETACLALFAPDGSEECEQLWRELRTCPAVPARGNHLRWGNDSGHDDFAVSLALCIHAAAGAGAPRVARGRRA